MFSGRKVYDMTRLIQKDMTVWPSYINLPLKIKGADGSLCRVLLFK